MIALLITLEICCYFISLIVALVVSMVKDMDGRFRFTSGFRSLQLSGRILFLRAQLSDTSSLNDVGVDFESPTPTRSLLARMFLLTLEHAV
jgi:hypothetical protein